MLALSPCEARHERHPPWQPTATQFLAAGPVDELPLVAAPCFVGDPAAPRFVHDGSFPWNRDHRARLHEVTQIGDCVLLHYALSDRFGTR